MEENLKVVYIEKEKEEKLKKTQQEILKQYLSEYEDTLGF